MYSDDSVHIEKTDQCYTCEFFMKGVVCPLLEALALGVVELTGEVTVQNCSFYKEFKRHLRVIDNPNPPQDEDDDSSGETKAKMHLK
jgi:hypothetical protein